MPKEKILITGASGFVGSFLIEKAIRDGYEVHAGVRSSSSKKYLQDPRINFFEVDFNNPALLKESLKRNGFQYIIQNAGVTKAKKKSQLFQVNAEALKKLIDASLEADLPLKKFVYISSLAAYGPADNQPNNMVGQDSIPQPVTNYGESKLAGENIIKKYTSLPYHIIRPTAVYGPREMDLLTLYKMLNNRIELLIGFKTQKLTFVYVEDLVDAILGVLKLKINHTEYFVTDGNHYSAEELNNFIKEVLGRKTVKLKLPLSLIKLLAIISEKISSLSGTYPALNLEKVNELKCESWVCEIDNLKEDLNFDPKYDLQKGITKTIKWYQDEGIL
jgi:nucleoside-diphosphate-sugar epimerase